MRLNRWIVMVLMAFGMACQAEAREVIENSGEWPGMVHPREFKGQSVPTYGMSCDVVMVAAEGKFGELILAWDGHRWIAISGLNLDASVAGGAGYVRINPGPGLQSLMVRRGEGDGKLGGASIRCGWRRWFR